MRRHLVESSLLKSHTPTHQITLLSPKQWNWLQSNAQQSYRNDCLSNCLVDKGGLCWWKPLFRGHEVIRQSRAPWQGAYKALTARRKGITAPYIILVLLLSQCSNKSLLVLYPSSILSINAQWRFRKLSQIFTAACRLDSTSTGEVYLRSRPISRSKNIFWTWAA